MGQRLIELVRFRGGQSNILVATDLASRGLDIPQVEFVINFDIPRSGFEYIHRIGRCGRIDRCGMAITFVSQFDIFLLQKIEQHIQSKMREYKVKKYEKLVMERMKKVLIVRAGIINGIETKYLIDPHVFKRDAKLRWDGQFTDPRILGKVNLKNGDEFGTPSQYQHNEKKYGNNYNVKKNDYSNEEFEIAKRQWNAGSKTAKATINENPELYKDFRTAFDNEYIEKNAVEQKEIAKQELDEQKRRERSFMKDLKTKEVQTTAVETMNVDKTMDVVKNDGEEGMDD